MENFDKADLSRDDRRWCHETADGSPDATTMKCSGGGTGVPVEQGANEEVELECFPVATRGGPFVTDTAHITLLAYKSSFTSRNDKWGNVRCLRNSGLPS